MNILYEVGDKVQIIRFSTLSSDMSQQHIGEIGEIIYKSHSCYDLKLKDNKIVRAVDQELIYEVSIDNLLSNLDKLEEKWK